ncbi:DNA-binding MarR family transcriptional regulator [Alicyclobacillus sacchari]|uniref:DNA-binding MarR family transcriptional regulator n=1 Tax=Alicyclobacillus sacchari TaxID=392010 RepID=A0A4R8LNV6_9BACL|nr:MarR family transcriptional regulator [Alicyclobacillus sacchari]TDY47957.1 DNA-binding MarR family transcriptional regulator [Alicyclobacillus sacchari]GMA56075.1 hypothetical protein GCM10025858_05780 [Alicyclobacillus sacchari]
MAEDIDLLTERFDRSLSVLAQHFGPHLVNRMHVGLTAGQFFTLHVIQQEGRCKVSRLAEKMEVTPSAITVMLDRLENHGLVTRLRDQEDRRVVVIELTGQGEKKLQQVERVWRNLFRRCLEQLDVNELSACIRTLESLAEIAAQVDVERMIQESVEGA